MKKRRREWALPRPQDVRLDIDKYINPFVPPSQLYRLPKPISRFLGYRETPSPEVGNILVAFWALVGTFLGLSAVGAVFHYSDRILKYHTPITFASLGAAAILDYNTIQSPLAQPRAAILGHAIAATSGVAVAKLFMLRSDFDDIRWIAGGVSCGLSSALMTLTNTVHPPGGATALLAVVDPTCNALGWMFIPLVLLGSTIMLGVGLLVNNIQRQYPVFWWTPKDVGRRKSEDLESTSAENKDLAVLGKEIRREKEQFQLRISLGPERVTLPENFTLGHEEIEALEAIRDRLRDMARHERALQPASSVDTDDTCVSKESE